MSCLATEVLGSNVALSQELPVFDARTFKTETGNILQEISKAALLANKAEV